MPNFSAPGLDHSHPKVKEVVDVQEKVTAPLLDQLPDILGTAVGVDDQDRPVLKVYVDEVGSTAREIAQAMPKKIDGVDVDVEFTGKFRAVGGKKDQPSGGHTTVSHKTKQSPPIQLGTSGGWSYDMANGYCCGGTLGALVEANGTKYIVSNYHVFESDIVDGDNSKQAALNDPIIHPGLLDVGCNVENAQQIGTLVPLHSLTTDSTYNVDVSVAIAGSDIDPTGSILEIGQISSSIAQAAIGQSVKKSGRTSGLTRSSITGLNGAIRVVYDNECSGGTAFEKVFTGQIIVSNKGNKFLTSGDSGSLLVEDEGTAPRAIGLLYAGGSSTAIANPIGDVLTFLSSALGGTASMVGQ